MDVVSFFLSVKRAEQQETINVFRINATVRIRSLSTMSRQVTDE